MPVVPFPQDPIDFSRQGIEVPGTRRPGQTGHYRNAYWPEFPQPPPSIQTVNDLFLTGLTADPKADCLGYRPFDVRKGKFEDRYVYYSYEDVARRRTDVGSALTKLVEDGALGEGVGVGGWAAGIWSKNCPEWQIIDLSLHAYSRMSVPLYDTLGPSAVEYVINHSQTRVIFCSTSHLPDLFACLPRCNGVRVVVAIDGLDEAGGVDPAKRMPGQLGRAEVFRRWAKDAGVQLYSLEEIESIGRQNPHPHVIPAPSDIASLSYTSGTTGNPKGVILLHSTLVHAVLANDHGAILRPDAVLASYLPLAHIFQRFCELLAFENNAAIAYSTGDPLRLVEDVGIMRPTFFVSVPRVLNRIYAAIKAQADQPGVKGALLRKGLAAKLERMRATGDPTHPLWDALLFRKIRAILGGRVEFIGSGSAPISPDVLDFLKVCFCCPVVEGYGLTENVGTGTKCIQYDPTAAGTVGAPAVCVEIKLVDVPEMSYTSTDRPHPRGEICFRGPGVMAGYYKEPEKTREAIDDEGWFHTGDVGEVDEAGRFKIVDRIKNFAKLAQGEYVGLEKVENAYSLCGVVAQIYVHADGLRSHLVAVIVPEPPAFAALASRALRHPIAEADIAAAAAEPKVKDAVLREMDKAAKKAGLKGFEMVKQVHITTDAFTLENDLLTPTLKLKRNVAKKKFQKELDALYESYEEKTKAKL